LKDLAKLSPSRWIQIIALVVTVSVVIALAHLIWRVTGLNDEDLKPDETHSSQAQSDNAGALASLLELAPFGRVATKETLPPTLLPLVLKGVVYSPDPSQSFALISTGGGPGQTWGIGQTPVDGAVIEAIDVDHLVLNVSGRRQALSFPPLSASGAAPPAPTAGNPIPSATDRQPGPAAALEGSAQAGQTSAVGTGAAPQSQSGSGLSSPGPSGAAGRGAMLSAAGLSVTTDGLRVGPDPSARLRQAGLQPGDLIRSLNGRPVADVASERQLIQRAILARSARVEVERDGTTLTLTLPLR
jgi:general secretion pathway protein C